MFAIFKREIRSYFQTVVGWLFIAAVLALYGLYFYAYNLRSGSPYVSYSLSAVSFIVMIAVPVLTMRSFAEERHTKTDQLMLTSPVPLGKIVFGKYLAMVGVFSIAMIVVALTPLFLSIYGSVPLGESYVAFLGFWLYGCACIAIGMLMSVVTESQVIAAVLGFAALFLGYMMSSITSMISQSGNLLTKILNAYDLYTPLDKFMNGCLDLTGVIYFLSVIGICLFLSCQLIQKRRYSVSTKKIAPGAFSIGMIVVAFAIAVVVNLVANELPSTVTAIDATSTKLYSITDTTKDYLKTLDQDVDIYVLAAEKNADSTLSETLQRYEDLSGHVKVSYVNPSTNPTFFQKYTTDAPTSNSLIVASDARSRVIDYNDIYEYSYDYSSYSRSLDGYDAEGQITSALQYVTKDSSELPVVYEITGHGETSLSGGFSEAIEKANMTLTELTLLKEEAVPDDASAIIINAPTSDFSADDAKKVTDYLGKGGKALITTNFQYKDLTNFESILKAYGIERVDGIVMENDSSYYYNNIPYYLLPEVESRYEDLSGHVKVSYVNPSTNPTFFQKYTTDAPTSNSLIVASDARSRVIDYNDIYEYSYDYSSYSRSLDGYDAEGQITSALQYVTKDSSELPVVYEITGHGETSLSGGFSEAIEKANMTLTELTLLKEEAVPDDASAIIINAPTSDFSADDAKKVTDYLGKGGKALITTNFQYKDLTNFESILKAYGIERVDGIVMENDSSYYYNNIPYYLLPEVESSDYTSSVSGKYIFAPYSEAFSYDGSSDDVTYTALLQTTDKAVSKIDADNATTSEKEDGDIEGPFTIALAAAKTENDTSSQVVVAGSMELFTDSTDQIVSGSNVSMFTDIMTNLTGGEDDNTSVIPVKDYKMSTITITSISTIIGGLAASIFIPVVLIIIGVVIWAVRRKK